MNIVRLAADDIEFLLELRMEVLENVFGEDFRKLDAKELNALRDANRRYYLEQLGSEGHIACAAFDGEELLGCGGVCLFDETPSPDNRSGKCAYIVNVYTRKPHRRKGIARAVCRRLIELAKERGAEKIYLESSRGAVPLYRSMGFVELENYFKLKAE